MTWKRKDKFPAKLLEYWIGKRRCHPRFKMTAFRGGETRSKGFVRIRWIGILLVAVTFTILDLALRSHQGMQKKTYEYGLESGWLPGGMFHTTVKYLLVVFGTVGCCVGSSMLILLYLKISFYWFSMRVQKNLLFFKNLFEMWLASYEVPVLIQFVLSTIARSTITVRPGHSALRSFLRFLHSGEINHAILNRKRHPVWQKTGAEPNRAVTWELKAVEIEEGWHECEWFTSVRRVVVGPGVSSSVQPGHPVQQYVPSLKTLYVFDVGTVSGTMVTVYRRRRLRKETPPELEKLY